MFCQDLMTSFSKKVFSQNVKTLLARKGWSLAYLARQAGVTKDQVSKWIAEKHKISTSNFKKIADALGVPVEELTSNNSKPTASSPVQDVHIRKIIREELALHEEIAGDSRLKLIEQSLEKVIGLLEPATGGDKLKLPGEGL